MTILGRPTAILDEERQTYDEAWAISSYADHSPGERWAPYFVEMAGIEPHRQHVLDAGCGAGSGAVALTKLGCRVELCDVTDEGLPAEVRSAFLFIYCTLWRMPFRQGAYDWAYCCDVLEHIPTEFTMLVVAELLRVAKHGAFLSITFAPDNFGVMLGRPLHQTVRSFVWWRDRLAEMGVLVACRDLQVSGLFLVRPA